jgi:hypothetical protein
MQPSSSCYPPPFSFFYKTVSYFEYLTIWTDSYLTKTYRQWISVGSNKFLLFSCHTGKVISFWLKPSSAVCWLILSVTMKCHVTGGIYTTIYNEQQIILGCMLSSGWFTGVCSLNANISEHSFCSIFLGLWRWNRQCVPKCWHINFRCRRITQKKAYSIQYKAKVWSQEKLFFL